MSPDLLRCSPNSRASAHFVRVSAGFRLVLRRKMAMCARKNLLLSDRLLAVETLQVSQDEFRKVTAVATFEQTEARNS